MDIENEIINALRTIAKDQKKTMTRDTAIIGSGLVDSLGIFQLIEFIEKTFHITLMQEDMHSDNFELVSNVVSLVARKLANKRD